MSLKINDRCVSCGACEWECPSQAISPGALRPVVHQDRCTECLGFFADSQCAVVCPVGALEIAVDEPQHLLLARFAHLFPGAKAHDTADWQRRSVLDPPGLLLP